MKLLKRIKRATEVIRFGGVFWADTALTIRKFTTPSVWDYKCPRCLKPVDSSMASGAIIDCPSCGYSESYSPTGKLSVVKHKVVTTAFVDFVVDQLQTETSVFGDFKYHENGLGNTAEATTDTDVETPTGISRATGTQTETDHDTYKSVATITADATEAWVEHGIFNDSSAGTLMDRTVHAAINVVSGNQAEYTFEISFTAGG